MSISGHKGRVTWGSYYTDHVYEWSMDVESEVLEDTAWEYSGGNPVPGSGADGWRTYIPGLVGFSGSISARADAANVADLNDMQLLDLTLYVDAPNGNHWTGKAFATGVHPEAPVDGLQEVSIDFQGSLELVTG